MGDHKRAFRVCIDVVYAFGAVSCLAMMLAACGGGGSSSVLGPTIKPAVDEATTIPFASVGTPIPLPPLGGFTESITLPTNSEQQYSNLLNVLISNEQPNGLPSASNVVRHQVNATSSAHRRETADGLNPAPSDSLLWFSLSSNVTVTFGSLPALSITLPSSIDTNSQNFYLAVYDPSNPSLCWETISIMTLSGNTLSFTLSAPGFTLFPNTTYGILIYGATGPTPAPVDTLYVSQNDTASVTEYAPGANGNAAPVASLAGGNTSIYAPEAVALDKQGELFVDNGNYITVYSPGAMGDVFPERTIGGALTGIGQSRAIAVDSAGDLYLANTLPPASILYFPAGANGNVAPAMTITGPDTGLDDPIGLALDGQGNLYVAGAPELVNVYGPGANGDAQPIRSLIVLGQYFSTAYDVAVDATGDLFVAGGQAIVEYPPGANGNAQPSRVIEGALTQLDDDAIAVDSVGYTYVQDFNNNQVLVFSPTADGDVAPVRIITGAATQLSGPAYLAVPPYFDIPGSSASPRGKIG